MAYVVDKEKLKDVMGRPLTQSLFIELATDKSFAVYSLADEDRTVDGKVYPSLKKLFLETMDPTGYVMSRQYLLGWKHWKRLKANKKLNEDHFKDWEEEVEVFMRSDAIQSIIAQADNSFPAAKFISEKGWDRKVGRPTKDDMQREDRIAERIADEFDDDIDRMGNIVRIK